MSEFSKVEVENLRKLSRHADQIVRDAEYQKSKAVVWIHWKAGVIGVAAFVIAVVALWSQFKTAVQWVFR